MSKRKSPVTAFFFSLIIPGSGQIYNGELYEGLYMLFGIFLSALMFPVFLVPIWIWSVFDAAKTAVKLNNSRLDDEETTSENLTDKTFVKGEVPSFSSSTLENGQFSSFADKPLSPITKMFLIATAILIVATIIKLSFPAIIPFSPAKTSEELLDIFSHNYHENNSYFSFFVNEIRAKDDLPGFWKVFIKSKYGDNGITATINEKNNICGQIEQKAEVFRSSNGDTEVAKDMVNISDQCLAKISDIGDYYQLEKVYLERMNSIRGGNDAQLKSTIENIASNAAEHDNLSFANRKMHDAYDELQRSASSQNFNNDNYSDPYTKDRQESLAKMKTCTNEGVPSEECLQGAKQWQDTEKRLMRDIYQGMADRQQKQEQIIEDERLRESVRRSYGQ